MFQNRTLAVQRFISFHHALVRPFTATVETVHHKIPDSSDSPSLVQGGGSLYRPFAPSPLMTTIPSFSKCEPLPTVGERYSSDPSPSFAAAIPTRTIANTRAAPRPNANSTIMPPPYIALIQADYVHINTKFNGPAPSVTELLLQTSQGRTARSTPHRSPRAYPFVFVFD